MYIYYYMKDYFYIINNDFLNKFNLNDDQSTINISTLKYKKDKQLIDDIINKDKYIYLNQKESTIIKKFNNAINNYDDNKNLAYLKDIINKLLSNNNEELLVYALKNRINSILGIDVILHHGKNYLYISQGKNNIINTKLFKNKDFLIKYREIIMNIMNNFIEFDVDMATEIVNYDILFANSRLSKSNRRNLDKIFQKYNINDIKFNNINFYNFINLLLNNNQPNSVSINDIQELIFEDNINTNFYINFDECLKNNNFKYYIIWCILIEASLSSFGKLYDQIFDLIKITRGIKNKMNSNKKKFFLNNLFIGHIISKEYFIYIDPSVKINIKKYIKYIRTALKSRLQSNSWMDPITKKIAIEKLENIKEDVYDSKLIDFNSMNDLTDIYYKNINIISEFYFKNTIMKIKNNQKIFHGNIYTINAFYDVTLNEIIFPYNILTPPYYYNDFTNYNAIAYNFGAIGSVIGHEIIHAFDDQGRLFDKNGNLNNWWQPESVKKYNEIANNIGALYTKYNINSKLTMGENIADIGGVRIALSALKLYLSEHNKELDDKLIDYFKKGWAMIWRGKSTKQELDNRLINDPHSPIIHRVNIPLNMLKEIKDNDQSQIIELW